MTETSETTLKAGCYRLYRYSLRERTEWNELNARGIHWLIIRCVAVSNLCEVAPQLNFFFSALCRSGHSRVSRITDRPKKRNKQSR